MFTIVRKTVTIAFLLEQYHIHLSHRNASQIDSLMDHRSEHCNFNILTENNVVPSYAQQTDSAWRDH